MSENPTITDAPVTTLAITDEIAPSTGAFAKHAFDNAAFLVEGDAPMALTITDAPVTTLTITDAIVTS